MNIFLLYISIFNLFLFHSVYSQNTNVKIDRKNVENFISDKFISFIINPQILLENNDKDNRTECLCMAQSLSPAYIQIGGPAIKAISMEESNLKVKTTEDDESNDLLNNQSFSIGMWSNFVNWTKNMNIVPILKLDFSERFSNGNWNPSSVIKIFSMADKYKLGECVWQFDYDCKDQSLDLYVNDLKTLKIVMDAFTSGRNGKWKIASGEIAKCLNEDALNKLTNFIFKSSYLVDSMTIDAFADVLYSNLSVEIKEEIQNDLTKKNTQLWKIPIINGNDTREKALFWLQELGNAAKEGYSVTFKDLREEDIETPTLSYYVSLIHKKFVGPEVLKLDVEHNSCDELSIYGHCAILPNGRIQNGVTLFAVNMGDSDENITFEFSLKEKEGEIMQFVLQSEEGKILVNGEEMMHDGDLQPVMSEVEPFKAMRVFLPSKSIGFWIVTNTNIDACSIKNESIKKPMYRNMKHKELRSEDTAEVLEHLIQQSFNNNQTRSKRTANLNWDEKTSDSNETIIDEQDLSDEDFKMIQEKAKSMGPYENFEELLIIFGQLAKMVKLEKEFLEIGKAMLKANETSANITRDFFKVDEHNNSSLEPLTRVIRQLDNMDSFLEDIPEESEISLDSSIKEKEISAENPNKESKSGALKLPTLPVINFNDSKETLDDLIERARKLMRNLNNTINDNGSLENFDSSNEKSPLVSLQGIKDPETFLKGELFKSKIKLKEIKRKIKARIAEIDLKTKLNAAIPHRILKRSTDNKTLKATADKFVLNKGLKNKRQVKKSNKRVKRLLTFDNFEDEIKNEIEYNNSKSEMVEEEYKIETKIVSLDDVSKVDNSTKKNDTDRAKNMIHKHSCAENVDNIPIEKLTWEDLTHKFGGIEETEDTFTQIINNINGFFDNMKNKVKDMWTKIVNK